MDVTLIPKAKARLEEKEKEVSEYLANGQSSNFEDYKLNVGYIRGMRDAQDILTEIQSHWEEDDG